MPIWRSGSGTNTVGVAIGTPAQQVNLTLTTNVEFILLPSDECERCVSYSAEYAGSRSSAFEPSNDAISYTAIAPVGTTNSLRFTGLLADDILADERGDTAGARPIAVISEIRQNAADGGSGSPFTLNDGIAGYWGLGIYEPRPLRSLIPDMVTVTSQAAGSTSYTIGLDVGNYSERAGSQAGTMHWGGLPSGSYQGEFAWLDVDSDKAAGWGINVDRIRVGDSVVDAEGYYGSLDPGYDGIYVPTKVAESLFSAVPNAARDRADPTRWNVPCDTNISMTVTIAGHEYQVGSRELVQARDRAGRTCWSSVIAWSNGSLPENLGEIRLGTPFMSGIYAALYYTANERYVGIAGKPYSVNAVNVNRSSGGGKPNMKLAGILIGTLLAVLIFVFVGCYARNRGSFQSIWYRGIRRQHRMQTNAMIRGATLPPPMMMVPPPTMPLMGGGPMAPHMGPYGRPMMGVPMNNMMWTPPAYQPPAQMQQQAVQQPPMPAAIQHQPQGFYSPRGQQDQTTLPMAARGERSQGGPPQHGHAASPPRSGSSRFGRQGRRMSGQPMQAAFIAQSPSISLQPASQHLQVPHGTPPRHDDWLRKYSGVGQNQQPYPDHQPRKTRMFFGSSAPALPGYGPSPATSEKRGPWEWAKRSKGSYTPVHMGEPGRGAMSSPSMSEKRRSWIWAKRGTAASETGRSKQNERRSERRALAGMYREAGAV